MQMKFHPPSQSYDIWDFFLIVASKDGVGMEKTQQDPNSFLDIGNSEITICKVGMYLKELCALSLTPSNGIIQTFLLIQLAELHRNRTRSFIRIWSHNMLLLLPHIPFRLHRIVTKEMSPLCCFWVYRDTNADWVDMLIWDVYNNDERGATNTLISSLV